MSQEEAKTKHILIQTVRIHNFRGLQNFEIDLPRVAVLIGPNNSGKTSVVKAIQLALGDYARYLSDEDFNINSEGKKASGIVVDLKIVPMDTKFQICTEFSDDWMAKLQGFQNGPEGQFYGLRVNVKISESGERFEIKKTLLRNWVDFEVWKTDLSPKKDAIKEDFRKFIPFISVDAQRDLHKELGSKSSFVGKLLGSVGFDDSVVVDLEAKIDELNKKTVEGSETLQQLKVDLDGLNSSIGNEGQTKITPFSPKLRDLSKNVKIQFGENEDNLFSMEYHGMGTRSWASLLSVKTLLNVQSRSFEKEGLPFFPIIAAEEPEAHLHPNAQKKLYAQLADIQGQVIISTHSPFVVQCCDPLNIRSLRASKGGVACRKLTVSDPELLRRIKRDIIANNGQILFANAIALGEGETEAQVIPQLFKKISGTEFSFANIDFIGIGGSGNKYEPYFQISKDFDIPVFVFSDGEDKTIKSLEKSWLRVFGEPLGDDSPFVTVVGTSDFEQYLIDDGFQDLVERAICSVEGELNFIDKWINSKKGTSKGRRQTGSPKCANCRQDIYEDIIREYDGVQGRVNAISDILEKRKTKYSPAIADVLVEMNVESLPSKFIEFVEKIKAGLQNEA